MLTRTLKSLSAFSLVLTFAASPGRAEEVKYVTSPATGKVISIEVKEAPVALKAAPLSSPVSAASAASGTNPVDSARNFLNAYGKAFGLRDPQSELTLKKEEGDSLGMSHVRFGQSVKGIPVFGAELIAHTGADGKVKSANGAVGTSILITGRKKVPLWRAAAIAKKQFKAAHPGVRAKVKGAKVYVLQPGLINNSSDLKSFVVWEVNLVNDTFIVDESYFVDAVSGDVRLKLDNVRRINRKVYDCSAEPGLTNPCFSNVQINYNNASYGWTYTPPTTYLFGAKEATGTFPRGPNPRYLPAQSSDTDDLFNLLKDVHDFYQVKFGRNGANDLGGNNSGVQAPLIASDMDVGWTYLNFLPGSDWPDNCTDAVYWSDSGVGFCKDLVVADVVGHEYAHGVATPILTYTAQAGALDESNSDIMGEMFEYWKTGANDWIIAETTPATWNRNFSNPPSVIDPGYSAGGGGGGTPYPDRFYSPNIYCGSGDNGGVHHNSTIPSKALYLASMGGIHNGCNISGLGQEKVEQIMYRALTVYYTNSETFNGAYNHLIDACGDLYGSGSFDCLEVAKALQAADMDKVGACVDPGRSPPATCNPPSCTNIIYHPEYNPREPTIDDRRNFCLSIGYQWAGVTYDSSTAKYHWYGNCRDDANKDYPSWNTDYNRTTDLKDCGSPPPVLCNDSDGGINYDEYFVQGRTGKTANGPYFNMDYCQLGGDPIKPYRGYETPSCSGTDSNCYLIEAKCGALGSTTQAYHCPNGCSGGKCS